MKVKLIRNANDRDMVDIVGMVGTRVVVWGMVHEDMFFKEDDDVIFDHLDDGPVHVDITFDQEGGD